MRLAFYTYSYTDRLEMPIESALQKIAATGYDGIDISGTHGHSADPLSVRPQLRIATRETSRRVGLRVEAVITHATLTDSLFTTAPLDLKRSVDLAEEVGAPLVVFHMGGPVAGVHGYELAWDRVVAHLGEALDYALQRRIKLAVDGVWKGWIVETPDDFMRLHEEIGSEAFGVNFDPCYLSLMDLDPVAVAKLWGHRIFHAHLKDYLGRYPNGEHRIPGCGEMDYERIVQGLADINFGGAIAVETFTDMSFDKACDVSYATFSAIMDRVGGRIASTEGGKTE